METSGLQLACSGHGRTGNWRSCRVQGGDRGREEGKNKNGLEAKINKHAEPNITMRVRQKVFRCSILRYYHANGQYVSALSAGSGGLL